MHYLKSLLMACMIFSCAFDPATRKQESLLCTAEDQANDLCPDPFSINQAPYTFADVTYGDAYVPGSLTFGENNDVYWGKLWVYLPSRNTCLITCTVPTATPEAEPVCATKCYIISN